MVLNETDCLTEPNGFLSKDMAILKSQNILRQRANQIYAKDTDESGPNPLYTDMSLGASLLAVRSIPCPGEAPSVSLSLTLERAAAAFLF